jgi:hypothetical protein
VRLLPLLVLALALAACGSSTEQTGVPASSGSSEESAEGSGTATGSGQVPEPGNESQPKPPPILLLYEGQEQKAVRGSYCVQHVEEATGQGSGACADSGGPIYPKSVTSVAGGDRVTFVLPEATFRKESVVTIRPLGCTDETVGEIALEPGTGKQTWKVDLDWGAYQLDVFARFKADDGRTGDVSGSLGLTVAGPKTWDALGVQRITKRMPVCDLPA